MFTYQEKVRNKGRDRGQAHALFPMGNKGTGTLFQAFQILIDDNPVMRAIWRIFVPTTFSLL
ncbi:MAG: hypothetical protein K0Q53_2707, partial [Massilibacillus sp.]|nr:hypothetical protein [Massilibacillus sp.]